MSTMTAIRGTYTTREAAARLGLSQWKTEEEIRQTGKIAGVCVIRVGRRILIPKEALDRVLSGESPQHEPLDVA